MFLFILFFNLLIFFSYLIIFLSFDFKSVNILVTIIKPNSDNNPIIIYSLIVISLSLLSIKSLKYDSKILFSLSYKYISFQVNLKSS